MVRKARIRNRSVACASVNQALNTKMTTPTPDPLFDEARAALLKLSGFGDLASRFVVAIPKIRIRSAAHENLHYFQTTCLTRAMKSAASHLIHVTNDNRSFMIQENLQNIDMATWSTFCSFVSSRDMTAPYPWHWSMIRSIETNTK